MISDNGRTATRRIWRTTGGDLVGDGHPDAAFLAYAAGEEVSEADVAKLKAAGKPADKAQAKPADKSQTSAAGKAGPAGKG